MRAAPLEVKAGLPARLTVVHRPGANATGPMPPYYHNHVFMFDWSRFWIMELVLDTTGALMKINPFLPTLTFKRPMDLQQCARRSSVWHD